MTGAERKGMFSIGLPGPFHASGISIDILVPANSDKTEICEPFNGRLVRRFWLCASGPLRVHVNHRWTPDLTLSIPGNELWAWDVEKQCDSYQWGTTGNFWNIPGSGEIARLFMTNEERQIVAFRLEVEAW